MVFLIGGCRMAEGTFSGGARRLGAPLCFGIERFVFFHLSPTTAFLARTNFNTRLVAVRS
jgi:hypothetical protein